MLEVIFLVAEFLPVFLTRFQEFTSSLVNLVYAYAKQHIRNISLKGLRLQISLEDFTIRVAAVGSELSGQLEMPFLRFDYRPYYSNEVLALGTLIVLLSCVDVEIRRHQRDT